MGLHVARTTSEGTGVATVINQSTLETLKEMRLGTMAATLDEQLKNPELYRDFCFEERFGLIVDAE